MKMPYRQYSIFTIMLMLSACSNLSEIKNDAAIDRANRVQALEDLIAEKSQTTLARSENLHEQIDTKPAIKTESINEESPVHDPLDDIKISLVVENESFLKVLKATAAQMNMNLLVDPEIQLEETLITVDFRDVAASSVLRYLFELTDLYGVVEDNMIVLKPYQQQVFHLSFMESELESSFSTGGDVLGGAGVQGASAGQVKGEFTVSGTEVPNGNPYEVLDQVLSEMIVKDGGTYSLNRLTGTLFVSARPSEMKAITYIINEYEKSLSQQVLIEAQIVEVELDDSFKFGIDWSVLRNDVAAVFNTGAETLNDVTGTFGSLGQGTRTITIPGTSPGDGTRQFGAYAVAGDVAIALTAIQKYGNVSVISNPSIRSKHGLPSMISVGTSSTYISDTKVTNNNAASGVVTTQEVKTKNVFDGLMLGVVPFIDNKNSITLAIHPVQSKVDPLSLRLVDVGSNTFVSLPEVELKSLVSQLKLNDGDMVILGGLIDHETFTEYTQVPVLGDIPWIGNLFKTQDKKDVIKELVIIIKVNLV